MDAVTPHSHYERLIAKARELEPVSTAVAHPCDETSLRGAIEAAEEGLIRPILVCPQHRADLRPADGRRTHDRAAYASAAEGARDGGTCSGAGIGGWSDSA